MTTPFSKVVTARDHGNAIFGVKGVDLEAFGVPVSPIALFDDFRVSGRPFGPHPHAGFSAITYVFEDSPNTLRSRDCLGNDFRIGPGGIAWLQAARGAQHEETPDRDGDELRGAQVYVNLSRKAKEDAPNAFALTADRVPEWRDGEDRVRVVVGAYAGLRSPLVPAEPFTFLDAHIEKGIVLDLPAGSRTLLYVRRGGGKVHWEGADDARLAAGQVVAVAPGQYDLVAEGPMQVFVLSGPALDEPVFAQGPYIMNDAAQIEAAVARYRAGEMGPLPLRAD
jgi:redox-sensitive bicupin YhaK (pirin superfamily)